MTTHDATIGPSVLQAAVSFSSSGDNIVIVGIVGLQIKVLQFWLVLNANTTLTYKSGSTALSGPLVNIAAQVQDYDQLPLTCHPGDSFIINSSNAVQVGGTVWFSQS